MASTSARHGDGGAGRIRKAASMFYDENTKSHIGEIRKILTVMKTVAVDLEKENQTQMVKELDDAVIELLSTSEDCMNFFSAIQSVGNTYQPGENLTDFKKLLEDEVTKLKATAPSVPHNNPQLRQFREAIWRVHHAGEPMPGEEQEDIVMTSTQSNIVNTTCPLSGKPIIELAEPVRSMDCRHIYDKAVVMHYMKNKRQQPQCPVAGCPKVLQAARVLCDPELLLDIDEYRSMSNQTARTDVYEDFTEREEEE